MRNFIKQIAVRSYLSSQMNVSEYLNGFIECRKKYTDISRTQEYIKRK